MVGREGCKERDSNSIGSIAGMKRRRHITPVLLSLIICIHKSQFRVNYLLLFCVNFSFRSASTGYANVSGIILTGRRSVCTSVLVSPWALIIRYDAAEFIVYTLLPC